MKQFLIDLVNSTNTGKDMTLSIWKWLDLQVVTSTKSYYILIKYIF